MYVVLENIYVILPGLGHDMNSVVSVVIVLITTVSTWEWSDTQRSKGTGVGLSCCRCLLFQPENVLYSHTGDDAILKVADFGMSRMLKPDQVEKMTCCGTPGYVGMYYVVYSSVNVILEYITVSIIVNVVLYCSCSQHLKSCWAKHTIQWLICGQLVWYCLSCEPVTIMIT